MIKEYADKLLELVNIERTKAGVKPLTATPLMHTLAAIRAAELEIYYSHFRPDGREFYTIFDEFGIEITGKAGENLFMKHSTPESVVDGWLQSEFHRNQLLDEKFNTIGVGVHMDDNGTFYWVLLFMEE